MTGTTSTENSDEVQLAVTTDSQIEEEEENRQNPSEAALLMNFKKKGEIEKKVEISTQEDEEIGKKWMILNEVLLGITICCAQIPESVAFSFLCNVSPNIGIHSSWIVGLVTAATCGRPGIVNGFTGALAAIYATVIPKPTGDAVTGEGIEQVLLSVILAGLLMMLGGYLRLARFISLVPGSVMIGFCNGLALVIGMSQLHPFHHDDHWVTGSELVCMLVHVFLSIVVMEGLPRIPHKFFKAVPSSLVAIITSIVVEFSIMRPLGGRTETIGDVAPFTMDSAFPMPFFVDPQFDMGKLELSMEVIVDAVWLAVMLSLISGLETLMTVKVCDELVQLDTTRPQQNQQIISMGIAKVVSGFMGGLGGHALIGESIIASLGGGGISSIAPTVAAVGVMLAVMGAYPVLNYFPLAALVGIMFVVVVHTFHWDSIKMIAACFLPQHFREKYNLKCKVKRADVAVMVFVTLLTVFTNLLFAVLAGVFFAALVHAWEVGHRISCEEQLSEDGTKKTYTFRGDLFFASTEQFQSHFDFANDPKFITAHLLESRVFDYSAIETLDSIHNRYSRLGKTFEVEGLCDASTRMIRKASGFTMGWTSEDKLLLSDEQNLGSDTTSEPMRAHEE